MKVHQYRRPYGVILFALTFFLGPGLAILLLKDDLTERTRRMGLPYWVLGGFLALGGAWYVVMAVRQIVRERRSRAPARRP